MKYWLTESWLDENWLVECWLDENWLVECWLDENLAGKKLAERNLAHSQTPHPIGLIILFSLSHRSHEQWDFPNGWSPLNHMIIEGLRRSHSPQMQQKAFWLAEKWILSNYRVFRQTRMMWEKYNVVGVVPNIGSGGEYEVQAGFG